MAETFKNARAALGTTAATVYTVPAATTAIVIGCQVANVDGTNDADVSCYWTDTSATADTYLAKTIAVPADSALGLLSGKLVLEAGDSISALASAASDLEISVSILEIT